MLVGLPASKNKKDWIMQIIYEAPPLCKQVVGSSHESAISFSAALLDVWHTILLFGYSQIQFDFRHYCL